MSQSYAPPEIGQQLQLTPPLLLAWARQRAGSNGSDLETELGQVYIQLADEMGDERPQIATVERVVQMMQGVNSVVTLPLESLMEGLATDRVHHRMVLQKAEELQDGRGPHLALLMAIVIVANEVVVKGDGKGVKGKGKGKGFIQWRWGAYDESVRAHSKGSRR